LISSPLIAPITCGAFGEVRTRPRGLGWIISANILWEGGSENSKRVARALRRIVTSETARSDPLGFRRIVALQRRPATRYQIRYQFGGATADATVRPSHDAHRTL
jgi:hypothetical protein